MYAFSNRQQVPFLLEKKSSTAIAGSSNGNWQSVDGSAIGGPGKKTTRSENEESEIDNLPLGAFTMSPLQTIRLSKPPPSLPLQGGTPTANNNDILGSAPSPSSRNQHQRQHMNLQSRNGTLVTLVHVGKTGGSALRDLIGYATGYCKVNYLHGSNHDNNNNPSPPPPQSEGSLFADAYKHEKTTLQQHMCALARITNKSEGLVHLNRNLDKTLTHQHFLIPVRNPVDRLVSWFYYERHFQTVSQTRYSIALHELIDPSRCGFTTANELFLGTKTKQQYTVATSTTSITTSSSSISNLPKEATPEYCYKLSRDCLAGDIPCYGHNFFNYEYYLEDVLKRVLESNAEHTRRRNENPGNVQPTTILPRVDVIRTENSWNDLNSTLLDWTGLSMTPDMEFFYRTRKPFGVDTNTEENQKKISADAATSLCETICPELIAYTKIIKYAANLSPRDKTESKIRLERTCGFSIDRVCGKAYKYRKIRDTKESRMCEPKRGSKTESGNGDSEAGKDDSDNQLPGVQEPRNDRHRRLAFLRGKEDLPPC